ncbi:MAG: ATP-dependent 6-phosphofructokinase [Cyanobacteria bacterium J003]|nr:MAG: ATP-dependent 6-phosphofructokinase [Cyanobacteria bacterium J003]
MSTSRKRLGVFTSGGDCPGLNTAIRAIVAHATLSYGWEVLGILHATQGLIERKAIPLNAEGLGGMDVLLNMGGTILGAINKGDTLGHADEVIAGYYELGLDALIAICGDGSLKILHQLAQKGNWNFLAVPKTIDNDVALTDRAIGFDTAVNTVVEALSRITSTAASHDRVFVVEVMGRTAGHLALYSGIAGGADIILIPEIPYSIEGICQHLQKLRDRWGRKFALIVVAEGSKELEEDANHPRHCSIGQYIADKIAQYSPIPIELRVSVLGHIQLGGAPMAMDRLLAAGMGNTAVDLAAQGTFGRMVAWQAGQVVTVPIADVVAKSPRHVDPNSFLIRTAQGLGIYVGDKPMLPYVDPTLCRDQVICAI